MRARRIAGISYACIVTACAALCAAVVGCDAAASPGKAAPASQPSGARAVAVPITAARAVREDAPVQVRAIAWAEAFASVTIQPQVDGQLQQIHFDEGQDLQEGDPLFTIDPRPFEVALRLAQANLARDRAVADDAQREAIRISGLFDRDQAAERERDAQRADAAAKAAQVQADEAAVENARLNLDYCSIRSPLTGRAGAYLAHRGNIVEAMRTNLVVINQISPIYVTFAVAEAHFDAIKRESARAPLKVEVLIPGADDSPEAGTLTFIDNQVDRSTGMVRLKATFKNEHRRLWPAQFLNATLTIRTVPGAILVPVTAVLPGQSGPFVYVVNEDRTVRVQPVRTGFAVGSQTVITDGLKGDELVATDGQLRLTPGAAVVLKGPSK